MKCTHAAAALSPVRFSDERVGGFHVIAGEVERDDPAPLGVRDDLGVTFRGRVVVPAESLKLPSNRHQATGPEFTSPKAAVPPKPSTATASIESASCPYRSSFQEMQSDNGLWHCQSPLRTRPNLRHEKPSPSFAIEQEYHSMIVVSRQPENSDLCLPNPFSGTQRQLIVPQSPESAQGKKDRKQERHTSQNNFS